MILESNVEEKMKKLANGYEYKVVEYGGKVLTGYGEERIVLAVEIKNYGQPILKINFNESGYVKSANEYKNVYVMNWLPQVELLNKILNRRFVLTKRAMKEYEDACNSYEETGEYI